MERPRPAAPTPAVHQLTARNDQSIDQKVSEARYFVLACGMSIEQAAAIVCCEPSDVQLIGGRPVEWIPTPAEVRMRCASVQRGWTAEERLSRLASLEGRTATAG